MCLALGAFKSMWIILFYSFFLGLDLTLRSNQMKKLEALN